MTFCQLKLTRRARVKQPAVFLGAAGPVGRVRDPAAGVRSVPAPGAALTCHEFLTADFKE